MDFGDIAFISQYYPATHYTGQGGHQPLNLLGRWTLGRSIREAFRLLRRHIGGRRRCQLGRFTSRPPEGRSRSHVGRYRALSGARTSCGTRLLGMWGHVPPPPLTSTCVTTWRISSNTSAGLYEGARKTSRPNVTGRVVAERKRRVWNKRPRGRPCRGPYAWGGLAPRCAASTSAHIPPLTRE